ncbi:Poly(A)-specific ribonuclease [Bertholletia excelsa]
MSTTVAPLCPKFIPAEQSEIPLMSKPDGFKFRLISYNILAQAYAKGEQFPHSPSPCRKWKTRSQAILTLLKSLAADFFCLQEVDEYNSFYKGSMESNGYASIYVQRSGKKPDGCGIFYKDENAELILEEKIEYNDLVKSIQDGVVSSSGDDNAMFAGASKKLNLTSLQLNLTGKYLLSLWKIFSHFSFLSLFLSLIFAFMLISISKLLGLAKCMQTTSYYVLLMVYFFNNPLQLRWGKTLKAIVEVQMILVDPNWADVKLAQAKYLLSRLAQFRALVSDKFECLPSVILAGDFNSTPGDKVYQYLVSGSSSMGLSAEGSEVLPMPLSSVYSVTRGEPTFTNCTPGFTGTLDYIFFAPCGDIKPVSFLELSGPESPDISGGLPNFHHPSDHLPIGAEFEFI